MRKGEKLIKIQMMLQMPELMPHAMMLFVQRRLAQWVRVVLPEEELMVIV